MKRFFNTRIIRFIVCGGLSALTEFLAFIGFSSILPMYWAALASFFAGLTVSFLLNKIVVFRSRTEKSDTTKEAGKFLVLGLVNSQISSWLTVGLAVILFDGAIAKVVTMAVIAAWNYLIMGKIIFKAKDSNSE